MRLDTMDCDGLRATPRHAQPCNLAQATALRPDSSTPTKADVNLTNAANSHIHISASGVHEHAGVDMARLSRNSG